MKKRSSLHLNAQKIGRKRDYETCQVCGSKLQPEGHHVFDYQYGGSHSVNNIITLCKKCHNKVHRGIIDIFVV